MKVTNKKASTKLDKAIKVYKSGDDAKAKSLFEEYLKKGTNKAEALYYLGLIASKSKNYKIAVEHFNAAIKLKSEEKYLISLGYALYQLKDLDSLEECYIKLLSINPSSLGYCNLGVAYSQKNQLSKAIDCYKKSLTINPQNANAYSNMGFALKRQNKNLEAIHCYLKAIELNPKHTDAYYNLGIAYKDNLQIKKSIECYKKVLEIDSKYSDVHLNLAISFLLDRNFNDGWREYEKRSTVLEIQDKMTPHLKPKWRGESLEGKNIYVIHEQGFGDIIQFSRFLPYLKRIGAEKIFFKSRPEMINLFKQSNLLGVEIVDADIDESTINFDYYVPLLSLPYYLKINEYNIPSSDKYLSVNKRKVNNYKKKFFNNQKYKIGIFWQGSTEFGGDAHRSFALEHFYPLLDYHDNIEIYSIQKNFGSEQLDELPEKYKIINLGNTFSDFSDTAAAIENLDLLISVDSSVAHLAGALGKEAWIILSEIPEWRWGTEEDLTIWYKSIRLFRPILGNQKHQTMTRVFQALNKKLVNLLLASL